MSDEKSLLDLISSFGGDPADMPFWESCQSGKFLLHRCDLCDQYYWPATRCVIHGNSAMQWVESGGRGQLHTYTVMHRVLSPTFKGKVPYVVGVIQLDEGPFFHSNVVNCDSPEIKVGMRLQAVMTNHASGFSIPVFQPE